MADPVGTVSGIVSGINYRDLVDQIITAESRPATKARAHVTHLNDQLTALKTYRGLVDALSAAAKSLRDGSAFDPMSATSAVVSGSKPLATASASATAVAGSYNIAVTTLAQAQKLGGTTVASTTSPLGFTAITVSATDTLADIRDRINALNTGATPIKVSASILSIGAASNRLVLTSQTAGSAGITLADTTGNVLQSLGILSNATTVNPAAVLVKGTDAVFSVDGVAMTRTTNSVTDAIQGVTLNLTAAESGAVTSITIDHFADGVHTNMQAFVDAYNKLGDFLRTQQTPSPGATSQPALYGENVLRVARSALPSAIVNSVPGTAADLSSASMAGLSLDKTGKLSFDSAKFDGFFQTRIGDLRQLFQQAGTTSVAALSYVTSTIDTKAGAYAVNVTTAPTHAQVTGTGLGGGAYVDDGTPDTMTVTDGRSGKTASITLSSGMNATAIAAALTTAFATNGLGIQASAVGGEVQLTQNGYGTQATITVAYTAGGTLSGTLPIAAGMTAGIDIQGTIGGFAATGAGSVLLGNTGSDVAGLAVGYTGAATGAVGTVTMTLGDGASIERILDTLSRTNTGSVSIKETSINTQITRLNDQATAIDDREAQRRTTLLKQFANMEVALSKLQSQSAGVLALLNSTQSGGNK
jgi:flagellar hook-associated protein 2